VVDLSTPTASGGGASAITRDEYFDADESHETDSASNSKLVQVRRR
jgi:hypothetical protein